MASKAGSELRAALGAGRIKVKDNGDFWMITAPTPNASSCPPVEKNGRLGDRSPQALAIAATLDSTVFSVSTS